MKTLRMLCKLLTALSIGTSLSCAKIKVYDKEVCADLTGVDSKMGFTYGAHCAHTLTNVTRDIPKAQWDQERVGWLCTNSTGFNDTENTIDQFCQLYGCDYETRAQLQAALNRLRRIVRRARAAQRPAALDSLANPALPLAN